MSDASPSRSAKSRWQHLASPAAFMRLAVLIAICPILGLFGKQHWFLDLFNHLQAQYFAALLIISVVLGIWRKPKHAAISVAALLIPTARLAPLYQSTNPGPQGPELRVASYNVLTSNQRYGDAVRWTLETDPDFIYFTECHRKWIRELDALANAFPYATEMSYSSNFGFAFRSKHPIESVKVHPTGDLELPLLEVRIRTPHGLVTVFGCHPVPPMNDFWASERDHYLAELQRLSSAAEGHCVILGDLNATRWSHHMKPILTSFSDTQEGHGYSATWMRKNWLVTIPIDHILTRGFQGTKTRATGPDLGSDHRPVVAELVW
ncbi:endonuclease/exonuclease/phosphatase family protein [Haloferula chungangensis]|uniref:Endonuclease/exonuclease/phosphatase family protein n=1 Tax=Haloferula chungangensis TaxID=1048331 RepID=A0ABW2L6D0_9BACT